MNKAKIYLCKADTSLIGYIQGIDISTCSLKKNATNFWEITFDVNKYLEINGEIVKSNFYDSINEMMRLYLENDKEHAYFIIDKEPTIKGQDFQEIKTVTAHSVEFELSNIFLKRFKINCGTKDSQEYLATDENGEFNNINAYTGLPNEYISLVNYDNPQLSLLHLALQHTDWTVMDDIPEDVCTIKGTFEVDNNSVYSFLCKTVSTYHKIIFTFDRKNRRIGAVKYEDYGEDSGIFISKRNLMRTFEITSSNEDSIITKLYPLGSNNLGIEYVNFGMDYIYNFDYFMNEKNEYDDYKFVSEELHDKYNIWKAYCDADLVSYDGVDYTRRGLYTELTRRYNSTELKISELRNRLPNDGCYIDYKTFSLEELKFSLKAYNNALLALISLYKEDYAVTDIGVAPDYSPTPSTATNIKDTPYWYDFYSYSEKIIPQVEESLKMYCETDINGNLVYDSDGEVIELEFGNPDYYADETIITDVNAYEFEWSLYGLDELENKKKAWSECANILYDDCFILLGDKKKPIQYRTPDDNGWNSLTVDEQNGYTSKQAFINKLNAYLDYMSFNDRDNNITGKHHKGIIRLCEDAIVQRQTEIDTLFIEQQQYQTERSELANSVKLENIEINGELLFTERDLIIINGMVREKNYTNNYILITSLNDIVTTVDVQEELYQDAVAELYKLSQPQYSFSTEIENLYNLPEFKPYAEVFDIGTFIRVGFELHEEKWDNYFQKLRVVTVEYNPMVDNDDKLNIEYSTSVKSLYGISDLAFFFDENISSGSSGSSSSSGSGGVYGTNDADIQISNSMLNALLKTELFGTKVNDVILDSIKANKGNFNVLFARSGVFDKLESGEIKVSGDCIFNCIKSSNWNGTDTSPLSNTQGSIIELTNGQFNLAGGGLKYDGNNLVVKGEIIASSGKFTGEIIATKVTLIQGATIDSSSISNIAMVALTGDYNDLSNRLIINDSGASASTLYSSAKIEQRIQEVQNNLSAVAFSGDYNDLINKPDIPTIQNDINQLKQDVAQMQSDIAAIKTALGIS